MTEDAQRALKEIKEYDGQRLSLSVAKKKIQDKKKTGVQKAMPMRAHTLFLHDNFAYDNLVDVFHLAPKAPDAKPEGNDQRPKGFRKNKLKARLIIRNLSFQVQFDAGLRNSVTDKHTLIYSLNFSYI